MNDCTEIQSRILAGAASEDDRAHAKHCSHCARSDQVRNALRDPRGEAAFPETLDGPDRERGGRREMRDARQSEEDTDDSSKRWTGDPRLDLDDLPEVDPAHYEIGPLIGKGGMGVVMRARDRRLGRNVAVKLIKEPTPSLTRRFEREARITSRLQHPSIVNVHEVGRWPDGRPFYAMPIVSGPTLSEKMSEAATIEERFALLPNVLAIADALSYAHSEGVIHRDLKPDNVRIGTFGATVVLDWGLARDLSQDEATETPAEAPPATIDAGRTEADLVLGTAPYMPPEQARGDRDSVDKRADVYAIGAILYQILSGKLPYSGETRREIIDKVREGPPVPLSERQPELPRDLVDIVSEAMARDRANRYPSAKELAEALRDYQTMTQAKEVQDEVRRQRRRAALSVATAALLILVGIVAVSVQRVIATERKGKVAAEKETDRANRAVLGLLVDHGRAELLAGSRLRAAAYLSEAYRRAADAGDVPEALRFLLAVAMKTVEAEQFTLPGTRNRFGCATFSPKGDRIVTCTDAGAHVYEVTTRKLVSKLGSSRVFSASFHPDGERVVIIEADTANEAKVWTTSGEFLRSFGRDGGRMHNAFFTHDGKLLVTDGEDRVVWLWDAESSELLASLDGRLFPSRMPREAGLSDDDGRLLTLDSDWYWVKVWDVRHRALLRTISVDATREDVSAAALSPDGARVLVAVSGEGDPVVHVSDVDTGETLFALVGHADGVYCASFSRDGEWIVTTSWDDTAKVWNGSTGVLVMSAPVPEWDGKCASLNPDASMLATPRVDGTVQVWETAFGSRLLSFEGHRDIVRTAEFSPDSRRMLTTSDDGTTRLWGRASSLQLVDVPEVSAFYVSVISPDGELVVAMRPGVAELWDSRSRKRIALKGFKRDAFGAGPWVFSADGELLAKDEWIWQTGSGELLATLPGHRVLAIGREGRLVTEHHLGLDVLNRIPPGGPASRRTTSWERHRRLEPGPHLGTVAAFSPDGSRIATLDDGMLKTWDVSSGEKTASTREGPDSFAAGVDFSADNSRIVTTTRFGTKLWKASPLELGAELDHAAAMSNARLTKAAFSRDGSLVITATEDRTARIWEAASGRLVHALEGHRAPVTSVGFSPDGSFAVTAADDGVKLWDAPTGDLLAMYSFHGTPEAEVLAAFASDEHQLVAVSEGSVKIWDVSPEKRTPDAITAAVDRRVPWRLVDGRLLPRSLGRPAATVDDPGSRTSAE